MLEEIKKALEQADDIAISEEIGCCDALNAIKDLEVELEVVKRDKANLERTIAEINEALAANGISIDCDGNVNDSRLEKAKKNTAQELYTALKRCIFREVGIGGVLMNEYLYWNKAKEFFKEHGVEVEE